MKKPEYNWADAWLLLSVIYAGSAGADLRRIIAIGDGINHAIFNPDELESGLARLTSGGYIKETNGVFYATDQILKVYEETTTRTRDIQKDLEGIEKLLGAADPYSNQPRTNNLRYAGFSEAAYTEAVDQYIEGFGKR